MSENQVLLIEDDPDGRRSVKEALEGAGLRVTAAPAGTPGLQAFRNGSFSAVLTDLVLPDIDGLEVLRQVRRADTRVPVIVMTAYGSVSTSVEAMKNGAYDYITKPLDLDDLESKIARAVETCQLRRQVARLSESMAERFTASAMVAESPGMREIVRQIGALAGTNATVLVRGESGTGKELVARALHVDGARAGGPFVAVNCGAFAETLLESELFGHEKGAFTGATNRHKGAFERADGGTLLLDEIGDAPPSVQVKLLRVIEEREVIRLGGQEPFRVDVRLISASNRDLERMVAEGTFREDLLYRLNVVTLTVPPLRERREDIRPLVDRFAAAAAEEHGRYVASIKKEFYEALEKQDWPGNIRQLRNVIESAVVMTSKPDLDASALSGAHAVRRDSDGFTVPPEMTLDELEREALLQGLRRHGGNRTLTAELLGISRRTIQRKIKEHDLPF